MANFECPECNICFAASHQRDGHRRLVHQSTCKIRTATGRITVNRSIDGKYPCPVDYCKSTFERSDNLQCHFKVQHAQQNNSALNQNLDDTVQKAMSLGMLIQPPVEQTPELLRDVGLIVLNIMDGIRLLLCKVCNVCLEPKPCQVHTHLLGHDNRRAPKRHRNGRQRRVTTIPPVMDFASLFEEIEFTPLQDPRLERYTTSPPPELLSVVPGSRSSMDIDARQMDVCTIALPRKLLPTTVWPTIFFYRLMPVVNRAKCSAFSNRSGTPRILVSTARIWSLQVIRWGCN
ncbi:unnamed protein product [Sphagnum balticum]